MTKSKIICSKWEEEQDGQRTFWVSIQEGEQVYQFRITEENWEDFIEPHVYNRVRDEILETIRRSVKGDASQE